jgi:hypothetical protein
MRWRTLKPALECEASTSQGWAPADEATTGAAGAALEEAELEVAVELMTESPLG